MDRVIDYTKSEEQSMPDIITICFVKLMTALQKGSLYKELLPTLYLVSSRGENGPNENRNRSLRTDFKKFKPQNAHCLHGSNGLISG